MHYLNHKRATVLTQTLSVTIFSIYKYFLWYIFLGLLFFASPTLIFSENNTYLSDSADSIYGNACIQNENEVRIQIGSLYTLHNVFIQSNDSLDILYNDNHIQQSSLVITIDNNQLKLIRTYEPPHKNLSCNVYSYTPIHITPMNNQPIYVVYGNLPPRELHGWLEIIQEERTIQLILHTRYSTYLTGVLFAETSIFQPYQMEFLKAQAIASRSYMLAALSNNRTHQNRYDFTDTTQSQVFKGMNTIPNIFYAAVTQTTDMYLIQPETDSVFPALFCSCCGGTSLPGNHVFAEHLACLESVHDYLEGEALCEDSNHFKWNSVVSFSELSRIFCTSEQEFFLVSLTTDEYDYAAAIQYTCGNQYYSCSGESFRLQVGRVLGFNRIYSNVFSFQQLPNGYEFSGRGMGHGVGLCQYGAYTLASQGYDYREILYHYYPSARLSE